MTLALAAPDPPATAVLARRIARARAVFDVAAFASRRSDADAIRHYYAVNRLPYRWFHSGARFLHVGLSAADGRYRRDDLLAQAKAVSALIAEKGAARVLELGAATGPNSLWLATRHPQVSFLGLDLTPGHVREARARAARQVNFLPLLGDYHDLSLFAPGSLDIVFAIECLCYARDLAGVLGEVERVLAPGGQFVVFDGYRGRPEAQMTEDERTGVMLVERGVALDRFHLHADLLAAGLAAGLRIAQDIDYRDAVMPTLLRFAFLARGFFKWPGLARLMVRALPNTFLQNAQSGYFMPPLIDTGALLYRGTWFAKA